MSLSLRLSTKGKVAASLAAVATATTLALVVPGTTASAHSGFCSGGPLEQLGSRGDCVKQLQLRMNGYKTRHPELNIQYVTADGVFGPHTEEMLKRAQRSMGLGGFGKAGPTTWYRLQNR